MFNGEFITLKDELISHPSMTAIKIHRSNLNALQERYKDCIPFTLPCQHCGHVMTIRSLAEGTPLSSNYTCSECKKSQSAHYISNKLLQASKQYV